MHRQLILKSLMKADKWSSHAATWLSNTTSLGKSVAQMIEALGDYADRHAVLYGSKIGDDAVLGAAWEQALVAVRGLLNGELNGLDAGTVDGLIVGMLKAEGFTV